MMASYEGSDTERDFESPVNENSTNEDSHDSHGNESTEEREDDENVLKFLPASISIKRPVPNYQCKKCIVKFEDWDTFHQHLIGHVQLPYLILDRCATPERLPSDDEDHTWSDEEFSDEEPNNGISIILKNEGITLKKPVAVVTGSNNASSDALSKLANLGLSIKKPITPKKEDSETDKKPLPSDLLQKLGQLGGLKLKLQQTDGNNTFKVINGSDKCKTKEEDLEDEEEWHSEPDVETPLDGEEEFEEELSKIQKTTPIKHTPTKIQPVTGQAKIMELPIMNVTIKKEPINDDNVNRSPSTPLKFGEIKTERTSPPPPANSIFESIPAVARVKVEDVGLPQPTTTVQNHFSVFGKDVMTPHSTTLPVIKPLEPGTQTIIPKKETAEPVSIIEINGDSNDDDDDCCIVVGSTPPPKRDPALPAFPLTPKMEPQLQQPYVIPNSSNNTAFSLSSNPQFATPNTPILSNSTRMPCPQTSNSYNSWVVPKTESMDKNTADSIFESLLSSPSHRKESLESASEYISLDKLGPQHTCDICNMRFTDIILLQNHQRATGHTNGIISANSLVPVSTGALMPSSSFGNNSSIISTLFPAAKQIAELGKLSGSSAFTHQQNVMINIQSFPGPMGQQGMAPGQTYNNFAGAQPTAGSTYPGTAGSHMYTRMPIPGTQGYQGQYPNQNYSNYSNQPYSAQTNPYSPNNMQVPFSSSGQTPYGSLSGSTYPSSMPMPSQPGQYTHSPSNTMPSPQATPPMPNMPGQAPSPQFLPSSPNSMGKTAAGQPGIRIQNVQSFQGQIRPPNLRAPGSIRAAAPRLRMPGVRPGMRPGIRPGVQVGARGPRPQMKRPGAPAVGPTTPQKRRMDVLLPGRHDNEDCSVMSMQRQRDGLPLIQSVSGSKDAGINLGSEISITRKTVNREASAMANVLASRGIMVKQKAKSRSPSPTYGSSRDSFMIPEAKVGGGMMACRVCKKMFSSQVSLSAHMSAVHPGVKFPVNKCDECPASYPTPAQLQHHKRVFHSMGGANRELGLPVVDLSQEENLKRLSSLGIFNFIPLANRDQANGCFGIPVISAHNASNGVLSSLQALGADGLLSLGPLKPLPKS